MAELNEKDRAELFESAEIDLAPLVNLSEILKASRKNYTLNVYDKMGKWFSLEVDTFENLIDNFCPFESILVVLNTTVSELDKFCTRVYGYDFRNTYNILSGLTDVWMRRAIKNLSVAGNSAALGIAAKYFMKLDENGQKDAINIRIINDLRGDEKDDR